MWIVKTTWWRDITNIAGKNVERGSILSTKYGEGSIIDDGL